MQITAHGMLAGFFFSLVQFVIPLIVAVLVFILLPRPAGNEDASCQLETSDDIVVTSEDALQDFLSSHTLVDRIHTKVVGVTFDNDDGTNRQSILALCSGGDEIALRYFDYHGAPAYAVMSQYGQIGNLSADLAKSIDTIYDGCVVHGSITSRTGGCNGSFYGCNILLEIYREITPPSQPEDRSPIPCAETNHEEDLQQDRPSVPPSRNLENSTVVPSSVRPSIPRIAPSYMEGHRQSKKASQPSINEQFIAEAQWYAARGGVDLVDDE